MQAPTTPGGPPVSDPGERACPSCGASNGTLAAFCWQCYRPFGTGPVGRPGYGPPGPSRPGYGPPGPTPGSPPGTPGLRGAVTAPTPLTTPSGASGAGPARMVGLLVLGLAAAATVFFFVSRGPGVELPRSFGGMTRLDDPQIEAMLDVFEEQSSAQGVDAELGLYGSGPLPTAALAWISDSDVPSTDDAFSEFAAGFDAGLGTGTLDRSRVRTEIVDGVEYLCAPVGGPSPSTICIWQDDVFWLLIDLSGGTVADSVVLAAAAHRATAG